MMTGGMEHAAIMRSIGLMGAEVIPALRDLDPPAGLLAELAAGAGAPESLRARGQAPSD